MLRYTKLAFLVSLLAVAPIFAAEQDWEQIQQKQDGTKSYVNKDMKVDTKTKVVGIILKVVFPHPVKNVKTLYLSQVISCSQNIVYLIQQTTVSEDGKNVVELTFPAPIEGTIIKDGTIDLVCKKLFGNIERHEPQEQPKNTIGV